MPDALETQIVTPLGELSTASVHYHRSGINATVLDGVVELGFEYHDGTSWIEPPNCRFLSMRGSFDHLEETPTRRYSLLGVGWMLRQAKVWAANGLPVDADGKVQFLSANAGTIMRTLIQNAKGRGWGAGISLDFSATIDSAGRAWAKVLTIAYDLELDLESILTNLYQQGVCDYRWEGRTLRIFNPGTVMARDLSGGTSPVRLLVADGQTSAPEDWTNEDMLTNAMVLGEAGKRWEFTNGVNGPLGRLEKVITQGGVSDQGTASLLAETDLLAGSQTRVSYTREFVLHPASSVWPFRDYQVGDWIAGQRGAGFERLRTASLSLTVNAEGVKGHAVLGDRLEDLLTKLAKRTRGITGGSSTGGSGVRPAPEGPDVRTPVAPSGVVVAADSYLDNAGIACGRIDLDWAHSGTATNGTAMAADRFEVYYRVNETGALWQLLTSTQDTMLQYSPLPVFKADGTTEEQFAFKVRAVGSNGKVSGFSGVAAIQMEGDVTPPPVPQFLASNLSTWLRTVTARWSGKGISGTATVNMPRDFDHVNVYQGASQTGPWTLVGAIGAKHELWQSGTMPTEVVWFALTAVDRSGNESALSTPLSITPAATVNLKEITDRIDAADVVIKNAGKIMLKEGQDLSQKLSEADTAIADADAATSITNLTGRIDPIQKGLDLLNKTTIPNLTKSIDGKTTINRQTTAAANPGSYSLGDRWEKWSSLATGGKLQQTWRHNGTAWIEEALDATYLPLVDIGAGTFGSLSGGRIAAFSIEARHLFIGSNDNHASQALQFDVWDYSNNPNVEPTTYAEADTGRAIRFRGNAGITSVYGQKFMVVPGDKLHLEAVFRNDGGADNVGELTFGLQYLKSDGSLAAWDIYAITTKDVITHANRRRLTGESTVPAGAVMARPIASTRLPLGTADLTKYAYVIDPVIRHKGTGKLIVDGSIAAEHIDAASVAAKVGTFIKLNVTDLVSTGSAKINEAVITKLFTETFATNKLTAGQVLIGMPGNVLPDVGHNDGKMTALRNASSTCTVSTSSSNDLTLTPSTGNTYFRPLGVKQDAVNYVDWISVKPGQVWRWGLSLTSMRTASSMKFVGRTLDGQTYSNPPGSTAVPVGNSSPVYEVVIPEGCAWICPELTLPAGTANTWVDRGSMFMYQVIDNALIVDGAITTKKLTVTGDMTAALLKAHKVEAGEIDVNSLRADTAFMGSLRTGLLTANAITADMIGANAITSKHTLTGPLIRTAASGARTEMTKDGIRQVNASGNELVKIGYGIETGMSMRRPSTGMMEPLGNLVFGTDAYDATLVSNRNSSNPTRMVLTGGTSGVSYIKDYDNNQIEIIASSSTHLLILNHEMNLAFVNAGSYVPPPVAKYTVAVHVYDAAGKQPAGYYAFSMSFLGRYEDISNWSHMQMVTIRNMVPGAPYRVALRITNSDSGSGTRSELAVGDVQLISIPL